MVLPKVCLVLSSLLVFSNGDHLFVKEAVCHVTERHDYGCIQQVTKVRSSIQCVALCERQDSCFGASLEDDQGGKSCHLYQHCPGMGKCKAEDTTQRHEIMAKYCVHGAWDELSRSCSKCSNGTHGERCQHYLKSCTSLLAAGYSAGHYEVMIDPLLEGKFYTVSCYRHGSGKITTFLTSNRGHKSFNKTWLQYSKGFFMDKGHMFAGLELWYIIFKDQNTFKTRFQLNLENPRWVPQGMFSLAMFNASEKFKVLGEFVYGPAIVVPAMPTSAFSTWDNDNDGDDTTNCASRHGAGWWYAGCDTTPNPLGFAFAFKDTQPAHALISFEDTNGDSVLSRITGFHINFDGDF